MSFKLLEGQKVVLQKELDSMTKQNFITVDSICKTGSTYLMSVYTRPYKAETKFNFLILSETKSKIEKYFAENGSTIIKVIFLKREGALVNVILTIKQEDKDETTNTKKV